jgi:hypothetical protein
MSRLDMVKAIGALQLCACSVGGFLLGCSSASTPAAEDPATGATTEVAPEQAGAATDAAKDGSSGVPVAAPHGKRAPCSTDQSCNEDPAVSALWGVCTEMGVCECSEGFERSPTSDLCRPAEVR